MNSPKVFYDEDGNKVTAHELEREFDGILTDSCRAIVADSAGCRYVAQVTVEFVLADKLDPSTQ